MPVMQASVSTLLMAVVNLKLYYNLALAASQDPGKQRNSSTARPFKPDFTDPHLEKTLL
jgi:hypothetical protein